MALAGASPVASPTATLPIVRATNGFTLSQVISRMITANPAMADVISRPSLTASGIAAYVVVSMCVSPQVVPAKTLCQVGLATKSKVDGTGLGASAP